MPGTTRRTEMGKRASLLLSAGHGSMLIYSLLHLTGLTSLAELKLSPVGLEDTGTSGNILTPVWR